MTFFEDVSSIEGGIEIMKRDRTISDAIKIVLKYKPEGMTAEQIYKTIVENNLYEFNARNPQSVVVSTIRSSCVGVDNKFTTREKAFVIAREISNEIYYALNNASAPEIRCWFVGAYNDSDNTHQDEEFIEQGIWQNGYTDKFLDTVNSVKVGDKIAIKTSYTK